MRRRAFLRGIGAVAGATLAPLAWAEDKPGRWLCAETSNFVFYSTLSEDKLRAEANALESFHKLLSTLLPKKQRSQLKLPVYLTASDRDFWATAPDFKDSQVGGFYSATTEQIRAVSNSQRGVPRQRDMPKHIRVDDTRVVLFHEYAHHFVRANSDRSYPSWYHEGFAEFISTVEFKDKGAEIGKYTYGRASSLVTNKWLSLETVLTKNPFQLEGDDVTQFYAQAWLMTHVIFEQPERTKGFNRYIDALQAGGDTLTSFAPSFGISIADFEKLLREYRNKSVPYWTIPTIKPEAQDIPTQRLGASADELLMPVGYLRNTPSRKKASDTVNIVREQARKFPGDPFGMRASALAEVWYGDLEEARKQIDALKKIDARTAETEHLNGLCDLRAAQVDEKEDLYKRAQGAFGRAYNLDKTRASSMFRYVECGLGATGEINENLLNALLGAYDLAPQVQSIAITTASALMQNKRFGEAVTILRPLAADPHGEGYASAARDMMAAANAEEEMQMSFFGSATIEDED